MGDQTVPTHAHSDAHVKDPIFDDDPYENWMSDLVDGDHGHMNLTSAEVDRLKLEDRTVDPSHPKVTGHLDERVPPGVEPLYYLLYTTNQLADFFTSRDVDGDTDDRHNWIREELQRHGHAVSPARVSRTISTTTTTTAPSRTSTTRTGTCSGSESGRRTSTQPRHAARGPHRETVPGDTPVRIDSVDDVTMTRWFTRPT